MNPYDNPQHYNLRFLRRLPRYAAVEQYDVGPKREWDGVIVALLIVAVVAGYSWGKFL
jgi:hypothetical protein